MKVLVVTLLAVLLAVLVMWRPGEPAADREVPPAADRVPLASPLPSIAVSPVPENRPTPPTPLPPAALATSEITAIQDAIDNLEFVFRDYAVALGGNPVGANAEITAALRGDNAKQLRLDLPADSSVNPAGELCDPWGSPWFFHQLSSTKMEIRSAGKDRQLYTEDDFVR